MVPPPQRLTLISDPTTEFPNNKNNSFKVRLPSLLQLQNDNWHVALMSISVPDGKFDSKFMCPGANVAISSTGTIYRLHNYDSTTSKYQSVDTSRTTQLITLNKLLNTSHPVLTGVDFWQNVVLQLKQAYQTVLKQTRESYHVLTGSVAGTRHGTMLEWTPHLEWEGENLVLPADSEDHVGKSQFGIAKSIAIKFGFLNSAGTAWGPNVVWEYPVYEEKGTSIATSVVNANSLRGLSRRVTYATDTDTSVPKTTVFVTNASFVYFSRSVKWTFFNLNSSFQALLNTQETVMIYSDLAQSSVVGAGNFPLLRQVELQRKGQGRVTVEPLHREWVPVRSKTIDVVEIELSTASGPLTQLSSGKTTVTVGLQQHV